MKKLLISILCGIVCAIVLNVIYSCFFHPEIGYFKRVVAISAKYEQELRKKGYPCIILAGGSETRSSIIPSILMQEFNLPAVNMATAAPFGLSVNAAIAMNHLQPGDTLILSLLGAENILPVTSGIKLVTQLYGLKAFTTGGIPLTSKHICAPFTSDAASAIVSLTRKLTRGYAYIYNKAAIIHPDGWQEITRSSIQNGSLSKHIANDLRLNNDCTNLLKFINENCKKNNVHFCVMLPAGFQNEYETKRRLMHALQVTRMGIPVLRDERLGREPDNKLFADMSLHMNATGAARNTRILGDLILHKKYWNEQEILNLLQTNGFAESYTPQN